MIVGSSAGALTGLQFVVITLIMQARAASNERDIHAFGTPTVIHFFSALLISVTMAAPWRNVTSLGVWLAMCGAAGIVYSVGVIWHARAAVYTPDLNDWCWYVAFPLVAHAALLAAAILIWLAVPFSLVVTAVDAVFFLVLGVHNAWDTVTFIAVRHARSSNRAEKASD